MDRFKYIICLHKAYLDEGMGLTSYVKPLMYLYAGYLTFNQDLYGALITGSGFILASYLLGMIWFKTGMKIHSSEVGNVYNYFVKEMRNKIRQMVKGKEIVVQKACKGLNKGIRRVNGKNN